jgi:alpha-ribazole phosphatase
VIGSLWLLRHGEPVAETRGCCYGALDVELSPEGVRQAELVNAALRTQPLAVIYSSPRRRCLQGARILAIERSCPVETIDAIEELNFGEFEGRSYEEIAAEYPDLFQQWMAQPTKFHFPGGESLEQMWKRVTNAARILRERHTGESIAIVTHGGVIRILLAEALGLPPGNIFRIGQCYGAINIIRYFGEASVVDLVNTPGRFSSYLRDVLPGA